MTKTTLYINDDLYLQGKRLALETKQTMTDIINSALEGYLKRTESSELTKVKSKEEVKAERLEIIKRLRKTPYNNGFSDGVEYQRWVRS